MRRTSPEHRTTGLLVGLWALFIYATIFSDWFETGGGLIDRAATSSYLGEAP